MGIQLTDVVKNILIINILMYFGAFIVLGESNLLAEGRNILGLAYIETDFFKPYQLVSSMFMHDNFTHLLFNMLAIVFLGPTLEMRLGSKRFLSYYLVTGFGATCLHVLVQYFDYHYLGNADVLRSLSWGASGSVFGILIGFGMYFPNQTLSLIFPPISLPAKYFVAIYIVIELFLGTSGYATGIAHFAHLGGALAGFLMITYWRNNGND